jgi:hypothetical protein
LVEAAARRIGLHLPIPVVVNGRMQHSHKFAVFSRTQGFDGSLYFGNGRHVFSLPPCAYANNSNPWLVSPSFRSTLGWEEEHGSDVCCG